MIDDMQVYIANLGKYNEGELVGDWFSFPLDEEVIAERIGLNAEYEEYAIHDTDNFPIVPFPVSWTVKMKKKQKETQDILSYHTQAAGCSDKARAKASGGRQPIEECGRTGL